MSGEMIENKIRHVFCFVEEAKFPLNGRPFHLVLYFAKEIFFFMKDGYPNCMSAV
jgi:hypothetical protein